MNVVASLHPISSTSDQSDSNSSRKETQKSDNFLRIQTRITAEHGEVRAGLSWPLGAQELLGGVNFAIFSRNAERARLELFNHVEDAAPARPIDLDSMHNRTSDVWRVWVDALGSGQLYAYRIDGPYEAYHLSPRSSAILLARENNEENRLVTLKEGD